MDFFTCQMEYNTTGEAKNIKEDLEFYNHVQLISFQLWVDQTLGALNLTIHNQEPREERWWVGGMAYFLTPLSVRATQANCRHLWAHVWVRGRIAGSTWRSMSGSYKMADLHGSRWWVGTGQNQLREKMDGQKCIWSWYWVILKVQYVGFWR